MGIHIIRMPDIGEGIAEVELAEWYVKVGDVVREDQTLADVMTDKATVEIPSSAAGTVLALGGKVGEVLAVGAELIRIEVEGVGNQKAPTAGASARAAPPAAMPAPAAPTAAPVAAPAATWRRAVVTAAFVGRVLVRVDGTAAEHGDGRAEDRRAQAHPPHTLRATVRRLTHAYPSFSQKRVFHAVRRSEGSNPYAGAHIWKNPDLPACGGRSVDFRSQPSRKVRQGAAAPGPRSPRKCRRFDTQKPCVLASRTPAKNGRPV